MVAAHGESLESAAGAGVSVEGVNVDRCRRAADFAPISGFAVEEGAHLGRFEVFHRVGVIDDDGDAVASDVLRAQSDAGFFGGEQFGAVGRARSRGDVGAAGDESGQTGSGTGAFQLHGDAGVRFFEVFDQEGSELFAEGIRPFDAQRLLGLRGNSQTYGKENGEDFHDGLAAASLFCFRLSRNMANPPMRAKLIMTGYHPAQP